jgi:hypothetical protein
VIDGGVEIGCSRVFVLCLLSGNVSLGSYSLGDRCLVLLLASMISISASHSQSNQWVLL